MEMIGTESRPVARKHYSCDACPWVFNGDIGPEYYTADELLLIDAARADGMKILPGQVYVKQTLKDGGELLTYRARVDMHSLCLKYDMFSDA